MIGNEAAHGRGVADHVEPGLTLREQVPELGVGAGGISLARELPLDPPSPLFGMRPSPARQAATSFARGWRFDTPTRAMESAERPARAAAAAMRARSEARRAATSSLTRQLHYKPTIQSA